MKPPKGRGKTTPIGDSPKGDEGPSALTTQVAELAEVLRRHDLGEIEIEQQGFRLRLRRGAVETVAHVGAPPVLAAMPAAVAAAPVVHAPAPVAASAPAASAPAARAETSDGNVSYITSPFVGTFYRSPSPDSAPFVDAGTRVRKGQVICIVEAMKLMNEIESEIDGTIIDCLVENNSTVEYGEPLFKIKQG